MPHARQLAAVLAAALLLALGSGCTSSTEAPPPPDASPQLFDFTQAPDGAPQEPLDPASCKHMWAPAGTHPYTRYVNGMPMTRLCFIIHCGRCGLVRHECNNPRARP